MPGVDNETVPCPLCGGQTWDRRFTKRYPQGPDYVCRDPACQGVIWPSPQRGNAMDEQDAPTSAPRRRGKPGDTETEELF